VLRGTADAAALLQPPGELAQPGIVQRHVRDRGHRLAAPPGDLAPHLHAPAGRRLRGLLVPPLALVAARARPDEIAHRTPTRSTTKPSVPPALTPGGTPRLP